MTQDSGNVACLLDINLGSAYDVHVEQGVIKGDLMMHAGDKLASTQAFLKVSTLLLSILSTACGLGEDDNLEWVYIDNGAIQCEFTGWSEKETAQTLIDNGIDVVNSSCGYLTGVGIADLCGLGDTNINLHRINRQNIPDARKLGYEPVSSLVREDDKATPSPSVSRNIALSL